ncbi:low molecular weight phosphatase family protein [Microbacterium sp. HD4P20]|uniref:arsenate reductase/protein-tyrosine-phosphatase family protein n=1 Tax=Microbacterium sp. HD4P20 TaxID=2864874 RepID=UPI001C63DADC|nr:low molecular weight phosphatase family protein [Microbacterium sp. HD4P20]MCP2638121.1 low molecular weight phosphatase family protein [Microbacterium sp. HD4P20]
MFEILTVCTGNICRSPLAEHLLRAQLAPYSPVIASAGTRGLASAPMTDEAVQLAVDLGVPAEVAATHRSRFLLDAMLAQPDLILTMTRDHRREVAELAPARLRSTFTIREFARIASTMSDDELRAAAGEGGTDAAARVRAMGLGVAARRGLAMPPASPDEDDVIDPYRRSWQTYQLSASQLAPAIDQVVRAVALAATTSA